MRQEKIYRSLSDALNEPLNVINLSLCYNDLRTLTSRISELKNLERLDLYSNRLESLPEEISTLTNLQVINLGANPMLDWEDTFLKLAALPNLISLHIPDNNLSEVRAELVLLENLNEINLDGNEIIAYPGVLEYLEKLQVIQISNNPLKEWGNSFSKMKSLKRLVSDALDSYTMQVLNILLPQCKTHCAYRSHAPELWA